MRIAFFAAALSVSAWAADDGLVAQLTGPWGKGEWIAGGGTCRRPDLTFASGGMGLTVRFAQADAGGSAASFSTADAEGEPSRFTLRFSRLDPETLVTSPHAYTGTVEGARLTLIDADGSRRAYTRCDGTSPARTWELE